MTGIASVLAANSFVFFGAAVQATTGIGFALIAAPLLILLDYSLAPVPVIFLTLLLASLMSIKDRRHIDFTGIKYALAGYVPGTTAAGLLIRALPPESLQLVFAATIIVAAAVTAASPRIRPQPVSNVTAGAAAGLMGTISAIGGPPMGLLYQHEEGRTVRGTLGGMAIAGSAISIGTHAIVGSVGVQDLMAVALMSPGVVAGFLTARYLSAVLAGSHLRPAIIVLSILSATHVLITSIL